MNPEDDDPTIICKILKDFRENSNNYYRSSMLLLNVAKDRNGAIVPSQTRRSKFDDPETTGHNNPPEIPDKKMKLMTPNHHHQETITEGALGNLK